MKILLVVFGAVVILLICILIDKYNINKELNKKVWYGGKSY